MPPLNQDSRAVDVLVVDDLPEFARVICRALLREGVTVDTSPSTLHAIRQLEQAPCLVVVADLTMPGPDGVELLAVVERRWPLCRRVLLSAFVNGDVVLHAVSAHRIVDKAIPLERIVEIVLEELSIARS